MIPTSFKWFSKNKTKKPPKYRGEREDIITKGQHHRGLCGDGIVLYLDCNGGYTNQHRLK